MWHQKNKKYMKTSKYRYLTNRLLNNVELANLFNIHEVPNSKEQKLQYNLNKTVSFKNSDKIVKDHVDVYVVVPGDTWQIIAKKVYNNMHLWWIICKFNNIIDPTSLPEVGIELQILTKSLVETITSTIKRL